MDEAREDLKDRDGMAERERNSGYESKIAIGRLKNTTQREQGYAPSDFAFIANKC
jgi:hypothetical protein